MIPLLEATIGFVSIMLVLSFLVKSLCSLVKNYVDYYTVNFERETKKFLMETTGSLWAELECAHPPLRAIAWDHVGEEFLEPKHVQYVLQQITGVEQPIEQLQARLAVSKARIRYAFEMRMKNLAVALGLGLCLFLNVNALTIWRTLYSDGQVRALFADDYSKKALAMVSGVTSATVESTGEGAVASVTTAELVSQARTVRANVELFLSDVHFGVGRVWDEATWANKETRWWTLCYEIVGSLLTGILVSIGAPYWHDLLRALVSLRRPKQGDGPADG